MVSGRIQEEGRSFWIYLSVAASGAQPSPPVTQESNEAHAVLPGTFENGIYV